MWFGNVWNRRTVFLGRVVLHICRRHIQDMKMSQNPHFEHSYILLGRLCNPKNPENWCQGSESAGWHKQPCPGTMEKNMETTVMGVYIVGRQGLYREYMGVV